MPCCTSIAQRTAAAKFDKESVARALDDPPLVNGDGRVDQIAAQRPEPGERAILVSRGQTAESNHISGEDRSDLPRFSHGFASGFGDAIMNGASALVGRPSGAEKHFGPRPSDRTHQSRRRSPRRGENGPSDGVWG